MSEPLTTIREVAAALAAWADSDMSGRATTYARSLAGALATLDAARAEPGASEGLQRDALYRRIHAIPTLAHHGKGEQCFPITDAVIAALAASPSSEGETP